jgi:hypothetical protein
LEHNNVDSANKWGRPPALDTSGAEKALHRLLTDDQGTAPEVARVLHAGGKSEKVLHKSTFIRHAKAVAAAEGKPIRAVRGFPSKQLSKDTVKKRLNFATRNKGRSWANVMFTGRKKFHFNYQGVAVKPLKWIRKGEAWRQPKVNHAQVVNLYAGITRQGITKARIVAGTSQHNSRFLNKKGQASKNITAAEYMSVVGDTFLPEGDRRFGSGAWVLQQDNDPPSHKKSAEKAVARHNKKWGSTITLMQDWPPNSPDLSPIENLWGYVQGKVNARGCKTFAQYQDAVLSKLEEVPKQMLRNLCDSMPTTLADCLKAKGGKTAH